MSMKSQAFHPFLVLVALVALVGLACGAIGSPTSTPEPPTQSPPTNTPEPTPTETPTPTATPNYAATQAAQATEAAAALQEEIVALLDELKLPSDNGSVLWIQSDDVVLEMIGGMSEKQYLPLAEGITASDFVLKVDMTWHTNS